MSTFQKEGLGPSKSEFFVGYSDHPNDHMTKRLKNNDLYTNTIVQYSDELFLNQTGSEQLNTKHVLYSVPRVL